MIGLVTFGLYSIPLIPALILGADAVTGSHRKYYPSFFAQVLVSVGLPYQSLRAWNTSTFYG